MPIHQACAEAKTMIRPQDSIRAALAMTTLNSKSTAYADAVLEKVTAEVLHTLARDGWAIVNADTFATMAAIIAHNNSAAVAATRRAERVVVLCLALFAAAVVWHLLG